MGELAVETRLKAGLDATMTARVDMVVEGFAPEHRASALEGRSSQPTPQTSTARHWGLPKRFTCDVGFPT